MIPSCGADFGKLMDQAAVLKRYTFPAAMVLPLAFSSTPKGVEEGIRRFVDASGKPAIAYIKHDGYLNPENLARLVDDGIVCAVKYARVVERPEEDPYLAALSGMIEAGRIISGIGERPVIAHWLTYGLRSFTSGSVCIAPSASTRNLRALQAGNVGTAKSIREGFLPLEDMRAEISSLCVLHRAVELAGIADTGPLSPMLSNDLSDASKERLRQVSRDLLAYNDEQGKAA